MYFNRVILSRTVNVAICCPSASTAGWTSLFACDVGMRLAMGRWLKHSGIAALGSCSPPATNEGRLPAIEVRRGGCPDRWDVDCCSWLLWSCFPPLEGCLPPLLPSCCAAGAAAAGGATATLASFACALRATFSAFCFAFSSAFESFGGFADAGAGAGAAGDATGAGTVAEVASAEVSAAGRGALLACVAIVCGSLAWYRNAVGRGVFASSDTIGQGVVCRARLDSDGALLEMRSFVAMEMLVDLSQMLFNRRLHVSALS